MKEFNYKDYLIYQKWMKQKIISGVIENSVSYQLERPKVNQPHDKLFKIVLSEKREAIELINRVLNLPKKLEKEDIERYSTEHINTMFGKTESDIVYKIKNKDIFFLIEHQSTIDYRMPVRILRYEVEIIEEAIKGKKLTKNDNILPTVIPIVLYTGNRKWNIKKYIQECQEKIPGAKNMKFGEYNVVDVNDYTKDELEKDKFFYSKILLLEKLTKEKDIFQTLVKIIENETKKENKLLLKRIILIILRGKLSNEENEILLKKLDKGEEDMVIEVLQKENERQRNIGIRQGIKQGILETAKELLKFGMNKQDIQKVTKLTKEEIEKL